MTTDFLALSVTLIHVACIYSIYFSNQSSELQVSYLRCMAKDPCGSPILKMCGSQVNEYSTRDELKGKLASHIHIMDVFVSIAC